MLCIQSLADRRAELCRTLFKQIVNNEFHSLHYLLPAKRDTQLISLLGSTTLYQTLHARTYRFKNSFLPYSLSNLVHIIPAECSGVVVEYRTRNREVAGSTHTRSTASNLEQVANLVCAQANSASYPQRDRKWVVATATGWRPSVADLGDVCLLAAPWVHLSVSAANWWPHNALRHHWLMPISCHFGDCKALLVTSLTHVSDAIASVQTFTFYL